jgi:tyrosine-protein phosphatase SIW14
MNSIPQKSLSFAILATVVSIPTWAGANDFPGIHNFHKVNEQVYRGAQPTEQGFQALAKLGVKTVIDLRRENEHSTVEERRMVEAAGMRYVNFPMQGVVAPHADVVARVLAILNDKAQGPVFVHCKQGRDRTGGVIACYRISHDGWENGKALKEAKSFGMHWVQFGIKSYVMNFRAVPVLATATTN